jgi:hypothetical protein
MVYDLGVLNEGDEPDLAGLLKEVMRDGVRLRVAMVRIDAHEGAAIRFGTEVLRIPPWLYSDIRASQHELLARVGQDLNALGWTTECKGSILRAASADNVSCCLEIG